MSQAQLGTSLLFVLRRDPGYLRCAPSPMPLLVQCRKHSLGQAPSLLFPVLLSALSIPCPSPLFPAVPSGRVFVPSPFCSCLNVSLLVCLFVACSALRCCPSACHGWVAFCMVSASPPFCLFCLRIVPLLVASGCPFVFLVICCRRLSLFPSLPPSLTAQKNVCVCVTSEQM